MSYRLYCIIDTSSAIRNFSKCHNRTHSFLFKYSGVDSCRCKKKIVFSNKMNHTTTIDWEGLERFIGDEIPVCVKTALNLCGFDTLLSLVDMNENHIVAIENCMTEHFPGHITQLQCRHAQYYESRDNMPFKFLPGHETLIMALSKYVQQYRHEFQKKIIDLKDRYSFMLNEFMKTAEENLFKSKHKASYSEALRFFSIYLQFNLPMPSTATMRK